MRGTYLPAYSPSSQRLWPGNSDRIMHDREDVNFGETPHWHLRCIKGIALLMKYDWGTPIGNPSAALATPTNPASCERWFKSIMWPIRRGEWFWVRIWVLVMGGVPGMLGEVMLGTFVRFVLYFRFIYFVSSVFRFTIFFRAVRRDRFWTNWIEFSLVVFRGLDYLFNVLAHTKSIDEFPQDGSSLASK